MMKLRPDAHLYPTDNSIPKLFENMTFEDLGSGNHTINILPPLWLDILGFFLIFLGIVSFLANVSILFLYTRFARCLYLLSLYIQFLLTVNHLK